MWYLPCGFMSAMCGTRAPMRLKSSSSSSTRASLRDREQVQHRVRRAAERHRDRDRVLERLLGHDLARPEVELEQVHHRVARLVREVVAAAVDARAATRYPGSAMPIASPTDAIVLAVNMPAHEPSVGHARRSISPSSFSVIVPGRARADGLEHAHDVERLVLVVAGQDRAAVEEHRRQVEPGRGHQHAGQALVAAGERRRARRGARRASRTRPSRR